MIKALIFDLDGTLIDSSKDLAAAMNHTLSSLGYKEKKQKTLASYIGDGLDIFLGRAFETDDKKLIAVAKPIFQKHYSENTVKHTYLFENVKETLEQFHTAGKLLFIFSNKPQDFIRPILDHFGISHCFTEMIGQYQFKNIKPHPEAIHYLLGKYKLDPSTTLMVGDNHTDIEAGHNAGIKTVFCSFGMGTRSEKVKADYEIGKFDELAAIVEG